MSATIVYLKEAYFAAEKEGFDPRTIRDTEGRTSIPEEAPEAIVPAKGPGRPKEEYVEQPGMTKTGVDLGLI